MLDLAGQREIVDADLDYVTKVESPVLIDEWQLAPAVWDRVRRAVDEDARGGRFLLAGSAGVAPGVRVHSGAGRIVSLIMRPLSMAERGIAGPTVSLAQLLTGSKPAISGRTDIDLSAYVEEILASGFPGYVISRNGRAPSSSTATSPASSRGSCRRTASTCAVRTLSAAGWRPMRRRPRPTRPTPRSSMPPPGDDRQASRATVDNYREHLSRIYVLDPIPAWVPTFNPLKRLTLSPKHHLVDPALAARLVGVGRAGLLQGTGDRVAATSGTWLGALYESLVAQSVRVYAAAASAHVGHLRTKETDHEIDLIVEGEDRRVVAIEVKLSESVSDKDVRHLNWLHAQIGDRVADRVLVNTGKLAYRRPDGVAVVPLALLGP